MRRLLAFAAFFLILSVIPVCAQRGGGHAAGGGSHGGFGGGHASFSGGHGSFGGGAGFAGHSFAPRSGFAGRSFAGRSFGGRGVGGSRFARGSRFFDRGGVRVRTFGRYGYPGWGYGYPWGYYAGIDPYWWWDSYSGDSDYADDRAMADQMNADNLDEQQYLREQDRDAYARPMNRAPRSQSQAQAAAAPADNEPATVLVYRDQHQREIKNYAIVDGLLYNFTPQRTEKIPLAILDIPATKQANEDRGVEFHLPAASEGQ